MEISPILFIYSKHGALESREIFIEENTSHASGWNHSWNVKQRSHAGLRHSFRPLMVAQPRWKALCWTHVDKPERCGDLIGTVKLDIQVIHFGK